MLHFEEGLACNSFGRRLFKSLRHGEFISGLEAQNAQHVKDLEIERSRISRLTGISISAGLFALAGLALAFCLAMQYVAADRKLTGG